MKQKRISASLVHYRNKSTKYKEYWLNNLVAKEQDVVDGGITRKSIASEMSEREISYKIVLRFEDCCKLSNVFFCGSCGHIEYRTSRCKNRICPICEPIRKKRIMDRYAKAIYSMRNPKMITVGIGHIPVLYGEVLSYWRKQFYRLIRKIEKKIRSGFVVIELSPSFHLHFHAVIDTPNYLPQSALSEAWEKISGRYIVWISKCTPRLALSYLIKYVVKSPEFESSEAFVDYYLITKNRRLFSTIGELYRCKPPKFIGFMICPKCGDMLEYVRSWKYVEHDFMLEYFGSMNDVP